MAKLQTTIGVGAGIFNSDGKLLLVRRIDHDSITGTDYAGNWELPIVAIQESGEKTIPYNYLSLELVAGVLRETGLQITVPYMPVLFPVMFKTGDGKYDLLLATLILSKNVIGGELKGETLFVSVKELNDLARNFVSLTDAKKQELKSATGLLSGFGKRQHCAALRIFAVKNSANWSLEHETLAQIMEKWPKV